MDAGPYRYRSPQMLNPKGYGTPMNTGSYKRSTPMDTGTSQMLNPILHPTDHPSPTSPLHPPSLSPPTCPDLVFSMEQSGMILESCTIQLLILSRRRRSTASTGDRGHQPGQSQEPPNPTDPFLGGVSVPLLPAWGPQPHSGTFVVLRPTLLIPGRPRRLCFSAGRAAGSELGPQPPPPPPWN